MDYLIILILFIILEIIVQFIDNKALEFIGIIIGIGIILYVILKD